MHNVLQFTVRHVARCEPNTCPNAERRQVMARASASDSTGSAFHGFTDFATNALRSGASNASAALEVLRGYLDNTRVGLRDQWNWAAVTATETTGGGPGGQPWCSSHYSFHLTIWHVPLALSGQDYSAVTGALSFAPTIPTPLSLPVLVSGAVGRLTLSAGGGGELLLSGGEFRLQRVAVVGREVWSSSTGVRALKPGERISWGRHE